MRRVLITNIPVATTGGFNFQALETEIFVFLKTIFYKKKKITATVIKI